jgi:hypothetical protein
MLDLSKDKGFLAVLEQAKQLRDDALGSKQDALDEFGFVGTSGMFDQSQRQAALAGERLVNQYLIDNNIPASIVDENGQIQRLNVGDFTAKADLSPYSAILNNSDGKASIVNEDATGAVGTYSAPVGIKMRPADGALNPIVSAALGIASMAFPPAALIAPSLKLLQGGTLNTSDYTAIASGAFNAAAPTPATGASNSFVAAGESANNVSSAIDKLQGIAGIYKDYNEVSEDESLGVPSSTSEDIFYDDGSGVGRPEWTFGKDVFQSEGFGQGVIYTRDPVEPQQQEQEEQESSSAATSTVGQDIFGEAGDTVSRQLMDAIRSETNPLIKDGLIEQYELYTKGGDLTPQNDLVYQPRELDINGEPVQAEDDVEGEGFELGSIFGVDGLDGLTGLEPDLDFSTQQGSGLGQGQGQGQGSGVGQSALIEQEQQEEDGFEIPQYKFNYSPEYQRLADQFDYVEFK